ncbi:hypothetical protein L3V82_07930 [Thiotrichales bacterium 19S3-7]|nr:hypothetical protein [Thiotrichales bacterium 19S3-7]MCF6802088.1 hypothetical protein [Thiotrichales bacterium 19S3-11]
MNAFNSKEDNSKQSTFRERWGCQSNWQVIMIFVVFSITGSMAVALAHPVVHLFGLSRETTSPWVFWPIRIAIIFPIYQVLLVVMGSLLGQHRFFFRYAKKMIKRFGLSRLMMVFHKRLS